MSKYKSGLLKPTDEGFSDGAIGGNDANMGDEAGDSASNSTSAAKEGGEAASGGGGGKKVNGALDPEVLVLRKQGGDSILQLWSLLDGGHSVLILNHIQTSTQKIFMVN